MDSCTSNGIPFTVSLCQYRLALLTLCGKLSQTSMNTADRLIHKIAIDYLLLIEQLTNPDKFLSHCTWITGKPRKVPDGAVGKHDARHRGRNAVPGRDQLRPSGELSWPGDRPDHCLNASRNHD